MERMADRRGGESGGQAARPAYGLSPLREADFTTREPEARQALEERMNRYFGTPLEMFPYSEGDDRPGWFHAFYEGTIEERFPDDQDLRDLIRDYRRWFTRTLWTYVALKRLYAAATMAWIALAVFAAPWAPVVQANPLISAAAALLWVGAGVGLYALVSFLTLRYGYEQRVHVQSADLSRVIVQRTRDLQNVYLALKAKVDLDETQYGDDGELWGEESARLVRLLMWIAKRVEYIEKFIQTEMWRIRRQRLWADFGGAAMTAGLALFAAGLVILTPTPIALRGPAFADVPLGSLGVKLITAVVFVAIAAGSFLFWRTPNNLASIQLSPGSWIRFGNLDLDNTIGDQVRRDKARLVEYRTLNRSLGAPVHRH
jgi:hypothetical protein